jgi:hypothetical protein
MSVSEITNSHEGRHQILSSHLFSAQFVIMDGFYSPGFSSDCSGDGSGGELGARDFSSDDELGDRLCGEIAAVGPEAVLGIGR